MFFCQNTNQEINNYLGSHGLKGKKNMQIKRDFFICWITLLTDLRNWDFKKKKTKKKDFV